MPRQLFLRFCPKDRAKGSLLVGEIQLNLPSVSNAFGEDPKEPRVFSFAL
jgi:hypothetical protein